MGCCLKEASEIGGGPGRKGGGGEGKPSPLQVFNTRRWVGEFWYHVAKLDFDFGCGPPGGDGFKPKGVV